jgi:hypothetical protein
MECRRQGSRFWQGSSIAAQSSLVFFWVCYCVELIEQLANVIWHFLAVDFELAPQDGSNRFHCLLQEFLLFFYILDHAGKRHSPLPVPFSDKSEIATSNDRLSQLTRFQRQEALERLGRGEVQADIARSYGVSQAAISVLANGI